MAAPQARSYTTLGSWTYQQAGPGDPTCWVVTQGLEPTKRSPGTPWYKVAGQRGCIYIPGYKRYQYIFDIGAFVNNMCHSDAEVCKFASTHQKTWLVTCAGSTCLILTPQPQTYVKMYQHVTVHIKNAAHQNIVAQSRRINKSLICWILVGWCRQSCLLSADVYHKVTQMHQTLGFAPAMWEHIKNIYT